MVCLVYPGGPGIDAVSGSQNPVTRIWRDRKTDDEPTTAEWLSYNAEGGLHAGAERAIAIRPKARVVLDVEARRRIFFNHDLHARRRGQLLQSAASFVG